jgi:hypothetical protein
MSRVRKSVVLPVLHSSGEVHRVSVPADTPLHELHAALSDAGYNSVRSAPRRHPEKPGKGSKAENVRQPRDGERVGALRAGPPNRPSMDSWTVNTEEPPKKR